MRNRDTLFRALQAVRFRPNELAYLALISSRNFKSEIGSGMHFFSAA
jgi:hypothetical protein